MSTPLSVAKAFLAGIQKRDIASMRALAHPNATACLIRYDVPQHTTVSQVLDYMEATALEMNEESFDEVEHVDGNYATVWTPYKFSEGGKLHHTGSNTFIMWKSPEKGWLITAISDVAREVNNATGRLWDEVP